MNEELFSPEVSGSTMPVPWSPPPHPYTRAQMQSEGARFLRQSACPLRGGFISKAIAARILGLTDAGLEGLVRNGDIRLSSFPALKADLLWAADVRGVYHRRKAAKMRAGKKVGTGSGCIKAPLDSSEGGEL